MKVNPLFKWFGSKWQSAKKYPKPEHPRLSEPFCGGAGYALNYCDLEVTIYDNDPNLVRLWPWLIKEATADLIKEIPINLPEGTDIRKIGLSDGQALLLKHWQRTNNVGDCWTISPWGNKPGQWTANTRARVAEDIYKIKHWVFKANVVQSDCTYFIDPPYYYNYRYRTGKEFSYDELVAYIHSIPHSCQVIVCEAVCPKTGKIPDYLPFTFNHSSVTSRRKAFNNHHSKELIYIN